MDLRERLKKYENNPEFEENINDIELAILMLKDIHRLSPDKRNKTEIRKSSKDKEELIDSVYIVKRIMDNRFLIEFLGLNVTFLEQKLSHLELSFKFLRESPRRRTGKNIERNLWIEWILRKLIDLGMRDMTGRRKFVHTIFLENDFDNIRTDLQSEDPKISDKAENGMENLKKYVRVIDKRNANPNTS